MRKYLFLFLLFLVCATIGLPNARADTIYTYLGNPYNYYNCYSCGPWALSLTFDVIAGTPLDNLTLFGAGSDITADISTFSITDGTGLSITQENATFEDFSIGTEANGDINEWFIDAGFDFNDGFGPYEEAESYSVPTYGPSGVDTSVSKGESYPDFSDSSYTPGYWYVNGIREAPEPPSLLLFGLGLLVLLALAARSSRHAPATS
jgi:hypothetical protein